jgi:hypothetical protein
METNTTSTPVGKPFTTNILAEPIAWGAPRTRYQIIGNEPWNDTGTLMAEVLAKPEKMARVGSAAAELGLPFEIVRDSNGTEWCILETQGSREAIEALLTKIEMLNIRCSA